MLHMCHGGTWKQFQANKKLRQNLSLNQNQMAKTNKWGDSQKDIPITYNKFQVHCYLSSTSLVNGCEWWPKVCTCSCTVTGGVSHSALARKSICFTQRVVELLKDVQQKNRHSPGSEGWAFSPGNSPWMPYQSPGEVSYHWLLQETPHMVSVRSSIYNLVGWGSWSYMVIVQKFLCFTLTGAPFCCSRAPALLIPTAGGEVWQGHGCTWHSHAVVLCSTKERAQETGGGQVSSRGAGNPAVIYYVLCILPWVYAQKEYFNFCHLFTFFPVL